MRSFVCFSAVCRKSVAASSIGASLFTLGTIGTIGTITTAHAQTFVVSPIAAFNATNGANPNGGLVMDSSGNLYGTTSAGGAYSKGSVFKISAGTNTITTVASFDGTNGNSPFAGLTMDGSGNLYGTTYNGGANPNRRYC